MKYPLACHKWHACQGLPTPGVANNSLQLTFGILFFANVLIMSEDGNHSDQGIGTKTSVHFCLLPSGYTLVYAYVEYYVYD